MGRKSQADASTPKPSKKLFTVKRLAIGSVLFVVFMVVSVEISSQSWFCNSCHIMEPFYTSWKNDTHTEVHCVECHIDPGVDNFIAAKLNGAGQVVDDLLNRTSPKPSASVSEMACTRAGCHTKEHIIETDTDTDTFKFSHEQHLDHEYFGIKMQCTTCHSHIRGSTHFEVNTGICITCHLIESADDTVIQAQHTEQPADAGPGIRLIRMAVRQPDEAAPGADADPELFPEGHPTTAVGVPPANCQACHEPPAEEFEYRGLMVNHADFLDWGASCESCHRGVTTNPNPIDDTSCLSCHTYGIDHSKPAEELHRIHQEGKHKIECFSCHGEPRHGPEAMEERLQALDCTACHIDQHNIQQRSYLAAGAEQATTAVSPMFMAHVDCAGCHVSQTPVDSNPHSGAMVRRAAASGCDACHAPGLGDRMIPLWQTATRGLYDKAKAEFDALDSQVPPGPARDALDEAGGLIQLVELDGSWGVHNPDYTQQLLGQAREKIAAAKAALGGGS